MTMHEDGNLVGLYIADCEERRGVSREMEEKGCVRRN